MLKENMVRRRTVWGRLSALGVCLLLLAILVPSFPLSGPAASASVETGLKPVDKVGVHQIWLWRESETRVDEVLDQMVAAGIKWLRMDFGWSDLEPAQGQWDLSRHKMVVEKATAKGINVLGIFSDTPEWAGGGALGACAPTTLGNWNTYVERVSSEFYKGTSPNGYVSAWEIWNEENIGFFDTNPNLTGTKDVQYMNLVKRASDEIRELENKVPGVERPLIVLGGVAMNGSNDPGHSDLTNSSTFVYKCLQANLGTGDEDTTKGATDYVDKIGYHPYPQNYGNVHPQESFMRDKLLELRTIIEPNALGLWITEFGWSNTNGLMPGVNEETQAAYAMRTFLNYLDDAGYSGNAPVEKVFYFNLWDQCHKDNTVFKTNDGGGNWGRVNMRTWTLAGYINYTNGVEGIAAERRVAGDPSCDIVIAVGLPTTRNMSISSDAGGVWNECYTPEANFLNAVSSVDDKNVWAVGGNGTICRGVNGGWGFSWSSQSNDATGARLTHVFLNDVHAVNLSSVWAAGDDGTVLKTTNGTTWSVVGSPTTANLNGVSALDVNTAWVVGDSGTVFKTTNGGTSWTVQASGLTPSRLNDVWAVDSNTVWAVGDGGVVLKTANGGSTWSTQSSSTVADLNEVNALNGSTAWAVGDDATLLKTADGGSNWVRQASLPTAADHLTSLSIVDANTVFVSGYREPVANDDSSITPMDINNFGLLDYLAEGKPAFNYMHRLGDANLFADASAIASGQITFSDSPATLEKHLFQMEDGSLLFSLWNSDAANNDPDDTVTLTLNSSAYQNPVLVDLLDGTTQQVQNVTRDASGNITVANLAIGKTPVVLKFVKEAYPAPTVTGITPSMGTNNGSMAITNLAGTNFRTGATVKLTMTGQPDIAATSVAVVSSTKIICAVDLTNAAVGARNVVVTNDDGLSGTLANGFTVAYPAPTVTGISPSMGTNNGSMAITNLAGTNFRTGATVKLTMTGQPDIAATSVAVVSSTKIICAVDLTNAAVGARNVTVTNDDAQSGTLSGGFAVQYPAPTVTSITPGSGYNNGSVSVTNLAGTNFRTGATVKLTRTGYTSISATNVVVVSPTKITCTLGLSGAAVGAWDVMVTNNDGKSYTRSGAFTIQYPTAPTVTSITPSNGTRNTTVSITNLAGTGFRAGATVKLTRTGYTSVTATNVVVVSSTKITCKFALPATNGTWNVVVTNKDGRSGTRNSCFTIK